MKIKLIKFRNELKNPTRAHYNDAGLDCYALEDVTLPPMMGQSFGMMMFTENETQAKMIPLGFGLEVPDGYMATIRPRSSMNKKGILTQIGTIDSGYRGEISAVLCNLNSFPITIKKDERICQIVIEPVIISDLYREVDMKENQRGDGGFGSTGK